MGGVVGGRGQLRKGERLVGLCEVEETQVGRGGTFVGERVFGGVVGGHEKGVQGMERGRGKNAVCSVTASKAACAARPSTALSVAAVAVAAAVVVFIITVIIIITFFIILFFVVFVVISIIFMVYIIVVVVIYTIFIVIITIIVFIVVVIVVTVNTDDSDGLVGVQVVDLVVVGGGEGGGEGGGKGGGKRGRRLGGIQSAYPLFRTTCKILVSFHSSTFKLYQLFIYQSIMNSHKCIF